MLHLRQDFNHVIIEIHLLSKCLEILLLKNVVDYNVNVSIYLALIL